MFIVEPKDASMEFRQVRKMVIGGAISALLLTTAFQPTAQAQGPSASTSNEYEALQVHFDDALKDYPVDEATRKQISEDFAKALGKGGGKKKVSLKLKDVIGFKNRINLSMGEQQCSAPVRDGGSCEYSSAPKFSLAPPSTAVGKIKAKLSRKEKAMNKYIKIMNRNVKLIQKKADFAFTVSIDPAEAVPSAARGALDGPHGENSYTFDPDLGLWRENNDSLRWHPVGGLFDLGLFSSKVAFLSTDAQPWHDLFDGWKDHGEWMKQVIAALSGIVAGAAAGAEVAAAASAAAAGATGVASGASAAAAAAGIAAAAPIIAALAAGLAVFAVVGKFMSWYISTATDNLTYCAEKAEELYLEALESGSTNSGEGTFGAVLVDVPALAVLPGVINRTRPITCKSY